jgi:streptogramin lyase
MNRKISVAIAVLLSSSAPHAAQAAAPYVLPPATAIIGNANVTFNPIALTGSGFGTPLSTSFVWAFNSDGTNGIVIYGNDARVAVWKDQQIVLKLPTTITRPQGIVYTAAGGVSNVFLADRYAYDYFSTNSGSANTPGTNPVPLALVTDNASTGWVLEEFQLDLKYWDLATGVVTRIPIPQCPGGCFAQTLFGNTRTSMSEAGESITIDTNGKVWFTQGGEDGYLGPFGNHSRVVSFTAGSPPSAGTFAAYNVPGDNSPVFGVTWDAVRHRVWFAMQPRTQRAGYDFFAPIATALPARIVSFDPVGIAGPAEPNNGYDFAGAAATLTCNGGSLGVGHNTCVGGSNQMLGCTTNANCPGGTCYTGAAVAPTIGTCSNVSSRSCFAPNDCVLADLVCPANVVDDTHCFHEYPVADSYHLSHLVVSASGDVWYANYGPTGQSNIERLNVATATVTKYPVHPPFGGLFNGTWKVTLAANGDVLISAYTENTVARFDASRVNDSACLSLTSATTNCQTAPDSTCRNPCITELFPAPGFGAATCSGGPTPGAACQRDSDCGAGGVCRFPQVTHGVAEDAGGNVWFNLGGTQTTTALASTVGYWKANRTGIVLLPTPQLFPGSPGDYCFGGTTDYYSGAEITVNQTALNAQTAGDVWFADFCRKRLGRLRRIFN